jgi:diguanylate cyclase (GGDEF)-like protein
MYAGSNAESEHLYPLRLRLLIASVLALAVPVTAAAAARVAVELPTVGMDTALSALVFLVLAFLADLRPVPLDESGDRSVSLAFVFVLSSQILFGWEYAVLTGAISVLVPQLIERRPPLRLLFSTGVYALAAFASGLPILALGHPEGASAAVVTTWSFLGGAAFVLVDISLVCLAVAFFKASSFRDLLVDNVRHGGLVFVTGGFLAALAVVLWSTQPALLLLLGAPLATLTMYQRSLLASRIATRHAHSDSLTGLGNHRSYELELGASLERAGAGSASLALCFVDVDDFKEINDTYGHPAGDAALKDVARLLVGDDSVHAFRLGGDEFAVVLERSEEGAAAYVHQLIARLRATRFSHDTPVTISVGVGFFPRHAAHAEELEHVVDSALYRAKHQGKNCYLVHDGSADPRPSAEQLTRLAARKARLRAAEQLIRVVDAKDTYTGVHSQSVARLAEGIARQLRLEAEVVEQVRLAGLLHDLGKIGIPDDILRKPGPLSAQERAIVEAHSTLGHDLLDGLELAPVDAWILHHHEHWDGTGYPMGLSREAIPLGSRIILVADAFDALVSERSYRPSVSVEQACVELRRMAGHQFDPAVVVALESFIEASAGTQLDSVGLVA